MRYAAEENRPPGKPGSEKMMMQLFFWLDILAGFNTTVFRELRVSGDNPLITDFLSGKFSSS